MEHKHIILILILALVIRLFISWQPATTLIEKITVDDALYGYAVAKNMAFGNSITYNGADMTNGFQPLWIFLIVPVFLLTKDLILAINGIYTILAFLDVLNVLLIYKLAKNIFNERVGLISSFIWSINPLIMFQTLNGLEVTLYITFVLASLYYYYKIKDRLSTKNMAILGLLMGLTFLARGDGIFLFIILGIHAIIKGKKKNVKCFHFLTKEIAVYAIIALLVVSPWLIWSYTNFGTIQQSSQLGKYYLAHGYYRAYGPIITLPETLLALKENFIRAVGSMGHQFGIIDYSIAFNTVILAFLGLFALASFLKHWKKMSIPITFSIFLLFFYVGYLWSVQIRYITPIMPFVVIFLALSISNISFNKKILALILVLISGIYLFNGIMQWERGYSPWQIETYKDVLWVGQNIDTNAIVGSFSSGIPIYFSNHTIVQLDGIMNFDVIPHLLNKTTYSYMKSRNITVWLDGTYHCYDNCESSCSANCDPPFYAKDGETLKRWQIGGFNIIKENMWTPVFETNAEFEIIRDRCNVYQHLRGFGLMICFYIMKVN